MKVLVILALAVAACSGRTVIANFENTGRLQPGEVFSLTNVDRLRALASQPGATLILLAPGTPGGSLNLDAGGALRGGVLPLSTLDSIDSIRAILVGQPGARLILLFPSLAGSLGAVGGTSTGTTSIEIQFQGGSSFGSSGEIVGVASGSSGGGSETTHVFNNGGTVGTGTSQTTHTSKTTTIHGTETSVSGGGRTVELIPGPNAKYDHDRYWLEYDQAWHPMPYNFLWGVNAPDFGDIKYHKEKRVGGKVSGEYALVEPDGSLRTVTFTADDGVGFKADVKRTLNFASPAPLPEHPWRVIVSNPPVSSDFGRVIYTTRRDTFVHGNGGIPHPGVGPVGTGTTRGGSGSRTDTTTTITTTDTTGTGHGGTGVHIGGGFIPHPPIFHGPDDTTTKTKTTVTETTRTDVDASGTSTTNGDVQVIRIPGTPATPDVFKIVYTGGSSNILGEFSMVQIPGTTTWKIIQTGGSSGINSGSLGTIDLGSSGFNGGFKIVRIPGTAGSPDTFQIVQIGGSSGILGGFQIVQIPGFPGTPATWRLVRTGGSSGSSSTSTTTTIENTSEETHVGGTSGTSTLSADGGYQVIRIPGTPGTPETWRIVQTGGSVGSSGGFQIIRVPGVGGSSATWKIVQTGGSSGSSGGFRIIPIPGTPGSPATWQIVQTGGSSGANAIFQIVQIRGTAGSPDTFKIVRTSGSQGNRGSTSFSEDSVTRYTSGTETSSGGGFRTTVVNTAGNAGVGGPIGNSVSVNTPAGSWGWGDRSL